METVFVPADLFAGSGIGDPFPKELARWRRLLVTMWVLTPDKSRAGTLDDAERARWVWGVDEQGLKRPARVTVVTALLQLRDMGVVEAFEEAEGGYVVTLAKEEAA